MSSVAVEDTIPTAAQADTVSIQSIEKNGKKPPQGIANEAELITARGNVISKDGVVFSSNDSDDSLAGNIFADPEVAAYYKDVYEKAKYECRHVFDPSADWTPEEEKAVIRKLDLRVCFWACTMFFALQVDRGNLVQAVSGTFLKDLNLTTNGVYDLTYTGPTLNCSSDYNWGNTVFLFSFLLAELPSQLISKKFGPDRWIPTQMVKHNPRFA